MEDTKKYIGRRIEFYTTEIKELLFDYLATNDERMKEKILCRRNGYEITLMELENVKAKL